MNLPVPIVPDPASSTIPVMRKACIDVLDWVEQCEDISIGAELLDRVLMVEKYLSRKKDAGEAELDALASARWLEVRIGELLGPGIQGQHIPSSNHDWKMIRRGDRDQFRKLAQYRDIVADNPRLARRRILRKIRDYLAESNRQQEAEDFAEVVPNIDIRCGDFRTELADLTDVDAVITDPPYPKEHLPLLADLAKWADDVLAPDGVLAILMGQTWLPDVYRLLKGGRPYRWTACYQTTGAGYVSHPRRVHSQWKPLLVYGGGPRFSDLIASTGDDKQHHHWGQNYDAFATIVDRLTTPGQLIVDPFMGAGTTLLAAKQLGRDAIGCDINPDHVNAARERMK